MFITFLKKNRLAVLITIAAVCLFINSGSWGVTETSEARYAEISREMLDSGDWTHPKLLGIGHYHKPPLTYIITTISYKIWGVNPFAVRFFLQIAILIQIILVYNIGKILFRHNNTAFLAAIIYVSFPAVIISSRALTTDAYLATFALAAIYCWMTYRKVNNIPALYGYYIFLALGFLTKGLLIFIVPLIVTITYNYHYRSSKNNYWHHIIALLLVLSLGFSWYMQFLFKTSARFRLALSAMGSTLLLTMITTYIFHNNPLKTNATIPITNFIKENNLVDRDIMVYNIRLPSVAFQLQKEIISIADGHHSLNREIQFESNENWRQFLINLNSNQGQQDLKYWLNEEAILITKSRLPESRKWMTDKYSVTVGLDKWNIFYNP